MKVVTECPDEQEAGRIHGVVRGASGVDDFEAVDVAVAVDDRVDGRVDNAVEVEMEVIREPESRLVIVAT